ncbi:kinase-like domain-containing protein [Aspergillus taichungensis]|uniref:Kinase-like domain-containing protein n=1 Tax=Aspergillus taichungensis TaxID=482145 RepID=A0A2J5IA11_9EURO|nr:kinase-like domain-containing protein [Aspergillus taichungensis]
MTKSLPLLRGNSISLEDALTDDDNILHRLDYPQKQKEFWSHLLSHQSDIEELVSFHLRAKHCQIADETDWLSGSYNVCIPVYVSPPSEKRVLVRIPLPFKIGETNNPGNLDEKLRCEVATYIWIHEKCPTVPIPSLYGFAFPDGQTFAEASSVSFLSRLQWRITRTVRSWLGFPITCPYVGLRRSNPLTTGYMITSFVDNGQMLSDSWATHLLEDKTRRQTLFRDLANIMISLNRTRLPHIGSLTLSNNGMIGLTNRPLTLRLQTFENEGIPTIPRDSTYQNVEPYILDLLQCHDNRIYYQPNAIHDSNDGQEQFAALTMMRGLLCQFVSRQYRNGPFVLTLTDLHPSNIFVDEDWHVTSLIDLEWACSFPVELQTPPYWLSGRPIDDIEHGEHLRTFEKIINEFMDAFEEQEHKLQGSTFQAEIMRTCWNRGSFWYFQAAHSPKGLLRVFNEHIQRRFCEEHCTQRVFDRTVSPYWCVGAEEFIEKKVAEEAEYRDRLRKRFGDLD